MLVMPEPLNPTDNIFEKSLPLVNAHAKAEALQAGVSPVITSIHLQPAYLDLIPLTLRPQFNPIHPEVLISFDIKAKDQSSLK